MADKKPTSRPYVHNGRLLASPPLTVQLYESLTAIRNFLGLYLVTLFSLDPHAAAQNSSFNIHNQRRSAAHPSSRSTIRPSTTPGSSTGASRGRDSGSSEPSTRGRGGGGAPGSNDGGRRFGTLSDLQGRDENAGSYCTSGGCG